MATILITGGCGLVGRRLTEQLTTQGHTVKRLSRFPGQQTFFWDPLKGLLDEKALEGVDVLIHLAGENIGAKPWTATRRKAIRDSRVLGLDLLRQALERRGHHVPTLISASAVGYYGDDATDNTNVETAPPANTFLSRVCVDWEAAALAFQPAGTRVVILRTGLVVSRQGGVLPLLWQLGRLGLLTPLGSGRQAMPWIHLDDLCGLYLKALDCPQMEGVYNAVAPEPQSNRSFSVTLASVLQKRLFPISVPAFLLNAVLGARATLLLEGCRVSAKKATETGFFFRYPSLGEALEAEKKL